jgi:solute carrier family 25 thiamine pyrophosphate transporter 19
MHVPAQDDAPGGKQTKAQRVALDATAGALAGAISRFMVGPLDVVKIRFQVQLEPISMHQTARAKLPSHYTGFLNAFKTIVAEEGIRVSKQTRASVVVVTAVLPCQD